MTTRFSQLSRFLSTVAGAAILLASGQAFASTVVVTPAPVRVAPTKVVVVPAPKVVVKPAPKVVYVPVAPLPTVVVHPTHTVYVASRPLYVVR